MKIGVFDSGIGGLSVANSIKQALPQHEIIFKDDAKHLPYGTKTPDEILSFCLPVLQSLVEDGVGVIVVACNTVSTNLIEPLRKLLPVPLIGMEPMVKPAAEQTKTGKFIVCATPRTLQSDRYAWLKETYAQNIEVIEPDCSDWTTRIVLGCTHYHWIEQEIQQVAKGRAMVLQPEVPVIEQLKRVLS
jgi:glutamate racemase